MWGDAVANTLKLQSNLRTNGQTFSHLTRQLYLRYKKEEYIEKKQYGLQIVQKHTL